MSGKALPDRRLGSRTSASGKSVSNKILLSIPDQEYRTIRPLPRISCFASSLHSSRAERKGEVRTFSKCGLDFSFGHYKGWQKRSRRAWLEVKGVTGIPTVVGLTRSPLREIVIISTDGFKVKADAMPNILKLTPQLQMTLSRYAVVQGMQVAQTVACNRLHRIEQRLARWLLMAQDRVDSTLSCHHP